MVLSPKSSFSQDLKKRCDWHTPDAKVGTQTFHQCIDFAQLSADSVTLKLPINITRIEQNGITFCRGTFAPKDKDQADIVYIMDNSFSMDNGGDPFHQRDTVVKKAMRQQRELSITTTAGFMVIRNGALSAPIVETQTHSPLSISKSDSNSQANLDTLLKRVYRHNDTAIGVTLWLNALQRAKNWLNPDSGFTRTKNQAIIFISDGKASDWSLVLDSLNKSSFGYPPVYGIHLGNPKLGVNLKTLSEKTGGEFFTLAPTDSSQLFNLMETILGRIVRNPKPKLLKIFNRSLAPEQQSIALDYVTNPDSSLNIRLDSIIALKPGLNNIDIEVHLRSGRSQDSIFHYQIKMNVVNAAISQSNTNLSCYDLPTLSLRDKNGIIPQVFSLADKSLQILLSRSPSELTMQSLLTKSNTHDSELIVLEYPPLNAVPAIQKGALNLGITETLPVPLNNIVEVPLKGKITLSWSHPRDTQEAISIILDGNSVFTLSAILPPLIDTAITVGLPMPSPANQDPFIFTTPNGECILNCGQTQDLLQQTAHPSWTFSSHASFTYEFHIFDNLGNYVNSAKGVMNPLDWTKALVAKDSAIMQFHFLPVSKDGRPLGTGAYILKGFIRGGNNTVSKNKDNEDILIKSNTQNILNRFGYRRK